MTATTQQPEPRTPRHHYFLAVPGDLDSIAECQGQDARCPECAARNGGEA